MEIDNKEFVETWQNAHGIQEIAEKFKIRNSEVYAFSRYLRKNGIELKKFKVFQRKITNEQEKDFILRWNSSMNIQNVCDSTGYSRSKVIAWSYRLRKQGVYLKSLRKHNPFINI